MSLMVWVCLHSKFSGGLRKTYLFYKRAYVLRISRSRSSKVISFGTNRSAHVTSY